MSLSWSVPQTNANWGLIPRETLHYMEDSSKRWQCHSIAKKLSVNEAVDKTSFSHVLTANENRAVAGAVVGVYEPAHLGIESNRPRTVRQILVARRASGKIDGQGNRSQRNLPECRRAIGRGRIGQTVVS
jgi:hypothetical protein